VQYALQEFFRHQDAVEEAGLSEGLGGKRVVIQGFGNVGYHAAKFLFEEDGCKVIAIADSKGVLVNEDGIAVENAYHYKVEHKSLEGYAGGVYQPGSSARCLEIDCDILIPAALEGQINSENVDNIKARLIIEAANGPVTFEADEKLNERGVVIIPDAYANAGGVIVSYFEWIRNLSHIRFGRMQRRYDEMRGQTQLEALENLTGRIVPDAFKDKINSGASELDLVRSGLDDSMRQAFQELRETRMDNKLVRDYRTAAYVNAIRKISRSYLDLGVY
jgi:glutamate dehydrogenase (NAD(P)+)